MKKLKKGQTYHLDGEVHGERVVDNVELIEDVVHWQKTVLIYSPHLRANAVVYRSDLSAL
jgi:hypothetical protein